VYARRDGGGLLLLSLALAITSLGCSEGWGALDSADDDDDITIEASDGRGGVDTQSWTLIVSGS
jgi:hypothetical protein